MRSTETKIEKLQAKDLALELQAALDASQIAALRKGDPFSSFLSVAKALIGRYTRKTVQKFKVGDTVLWHHPYVGKKTASGTEQPGPIRAKVAGFAKVGARVRITYIDPWDKSGTKTEANVMPRELSRAHGREEGSAA